MSVQLTCESVQYCPCVNVCFAACEYDTEMRKAHPMCDYLQDGLGVNVCPPACEGDTGGRLMTVDGDEMRIFQRVLENM